MHGCHGTDEQNHKTMKTHAVLHLMEAIQQEQYGMFQQTLLPSLAGESVVGTLDTCCLFGRTYINAGLLPRA